MADSLKPAWSPPADVGMPSGNGISRSTSAYIGAMTMYSILHHARPAAPLLTDFSLEGWFFD